MEDDPTPGLNLTSPPYHSASLTNGGRLITETHGCRRSPIISAAVVGGQSRFVRVICLTATSISNQQAGLLLANAINLAERNKEGRSNKKKTDSTKPQYDKEREREKKRGRLPERKVEVRSLTHNDRGKRAWAEGALFSRLRLFSGEAKVGSTRLVEEKWHCHQKLGTSSSLGMSSLDHSGKDRPFLPPVLGQDIYDVMGNYGVSWVGLVSGSQRNQLGAEINGSGGEPLIKITLNSVGSKGTVCLLSGQGEWSSCSQAHMALNGPLRPLAVRERSCTEGQLYQHITS
ncbi:hypothetical protein QQF64_027563 [Cirrhinus molitorella]|uniref:Uncharacterized protein n=1 Tax=Cirrhinus molitorella TaxID=172907 RepID=A0ABR3ND07_9TELE